MPGDATLLLPIEDESQIGDARRRVSTLAARFGADEATRSNLAIVISEMASNLVKHAREGVILVRSLHDSVEQQKRPLGFEFVSVDRGPGIDALHRVRNDGYSTAGTRGVGLGAVERIASSSDLYSAPDAGTIHVARVTADRQVPDCSQVPRYAAAAVAAPGEDVCGDGWAIRRQPKQLWVLMVDGLGHGILAHEAATQAEQTFQAAALESPEELLAQIGVALRPTRGAAVVLARIDLAQQQIDYAGIGNIGGFSWDGTSTRRMISMNGIVGHRQARPRTFTYPLPERGFIAFYTDGFVTQTSLEQYFGVEGRDPAIPVGLLYRDFRRGRDDATVLVVSVGPGERSE